MTCVQLAEHLGVTVRFVVVWSTSGGCRSWRSAGSFVSIRTRSTPGSPSAAGAPSAQPPQAIGQASVDTPRQPCQARDGRRRRC